MAGRLRIPLSLAFAVVSVAAACGSDAPPTPDATPITLDAGVPTADAHSLLTCVSEGTVTDCPPFADGDNQCPPGCQPVS